MFLAEATEFPRAVLDAMRQPLESGRITVHRSSGAAEFPARCQLVLAANPCPCGNGGGLGGTGAVCDCPPSTVRRYRGRLSGPLLDRIDLRVGVSRVTSAVLRAAQGSAPTTAAARAMVEAARARMWTRLRDTPWRTNGAVSGTWLRSTGATESGASRPVDTALERGLITMRGRDRVLRLAWTLADLDGVDRPGRDQVREALALRSAL